MFNEDSLYRAYKKRCKELPFYTEKYSDQKKELETTGTDPEGLDYIPSEKQVEKLVEDLEKQ